MIPLAALILLAVLATAWRVYRAHGGRAAAELFVDLLYALAHWSAASARAADCGLVAYRREREALADRHWPEYAR